MALKQDSIHFVLCPDQGNKIEGVVLNRVRVSPQGGQQGELIQKMKTNSLPIVASPNISLATSFARFAPIRTLTSGRPNSSLIILETRFNPTAE